MRLIALLLFLLQSSMATTARDDGPLSAHDAHQIRQRLIRSLGMSRVPDISQVNITDEEKAEAYRLYFARLKEKENQRLDQQTDEDDDDEEEDEKKEVDEEILSFNASDEQIQQGKDRKFPVQLRFPVDIPQDLIDHQHTSVLRIYKKLDSTRIFNSRIRAYPPKVTLLIYQQLVSSNNSLERFLIASHRILLTDNDWESLSVNVTYNTNNSNVLLHLECDKCNMYGFSIISSTKQHKDDPDQIFQQPTLNIYLSTTHQTNSQMRHRRSSSRHKSSKKRKGFKAKPEIFSQPTRSGSIDCTIENGKKCCRHRMKVNFVHLRMDFVIEPKEFEAYYCKGKCPRLYNPAHAHALIQSSMHDRGIEGIPKPCCAPSKLSNLTLMHYDENRKLKVTDWTNAVVEECACS